MKRSSTSTSIVAASMVAALIIAIPAFSHATEQAELPAEIGARTADDGVGNWAAGTVVKVPGGIEAGQHPSSGGGSVTPPPVVTSSGSGGSLSSGISSGAGGNISGGAGSVGVNTPGCLISATVLGWGRTNDAIQVTKLQTFLKENQKLEVDINGVYDDKTVEAVKSFQTKYAGTILAPWGASIPSGEAYITTIKQVNALACNQRLTLSAEELAILQARARATSAAPTESTPSADGSAPSGSLESSNTSEESIQGPSRDAAGVTSEENSETASGSLENTSETAAASNSNPSVLHRFWGFVKSLFY